MILGRRHLLGVLTGALCAPLVVRSGLLMPVTVLEVPTWMDRVAEGERLLGVDVGEWVRTHLDTVYRFSA